MATLNVPADGWMLSELPKPADRYALKKDKIPQSVELVLPEGVTVAQLHNSQALAVLGRQPHFFLGGKKVHVKLQLHDNGYLYKNDEGANHISLTARLDLWLPKSGIDTNDHASLGTEKHSSSTYGDDNIGRSTNPLAISRKRKAKGSSLMDQLRMPATHRTGLFDRSRQQNISRSLTSSPQLAPLPKKKAPTSTAIGLLPTKHQDSIERVEAQKTALIHLLAVRPVSKAYMVKTLCCTIDELLPLIEKHAQKCRFDPTKFELTDRGYQLLDPWKFPYPEEDRQRAIDRAIEAYDRKRLSSIDKEWQQLLPRSERGRGKCLSKLNSTMLGAGKQPPSSQSAAPTTSAPEIYISDAGSPGSIEGSQVEAQAQSHKRRISTEEEKDGNGSHITKKQKMSERNAYEKRLLGSGAKKEQSKLKKDTATKSIAKASPKVSPKAADKKSSQTDSSKFKSAEFIIDSDEETEIAAAPSTKTSPTPKKADVSTPAATKTIASEISITKPVTKPVARPAARADAPAARTTTPAAKPATSSSPRPSNVNAKKTPTANNQMLPSSQQKRPASQGKTTTVDKPTLNPGHMTASPKPLMPQKKKLVVHKMMVPIGTPEARAKLTVSPPLKPTGVTAPVLGKPAAKHNNAKPAIKTATAKPEVARRVDVTKKTTSQHPKLNKAVAATSSSAAASKPTATATKTDKTISIRASTTTTPAKIANAVRAPAMQKSISHQRKSSSPLKPSPLASSPPINTSDLEDSTQHRSPKTSAASTPLKHTVPAGQVGMKGIARSINRNKASSTNPTPVAAGNDDRQLKRKANDLDSTTTMHGSAGSLNSIANERPAKRRETGAAAPGSVGAAGSKAVGDKKEAVAAVVAVATASASANNILQVVDNKLAAVENVSADASKLHSPSPVASTIGSTSTKSTSASLLGHPVCSVAKEEKNAGSNTAAAGGNDGPVKKNGSGAGNVGERMINGFKESELERAASFEQQREHYNRMQREVARLDENPPVERVRELTKMYHSLETQKKVLAALSG